MQEMTKQETLDMAGKVEKYEAMLKEAHHLLRRALWVNWVFCRDADKLCDKIEKAVKNETRN